MNESTQTILNNFKQISQIPRQSKNEIQICAWLMEWARDNGFEYKEDQAGNVLIQVPASPGYEEHPIVILQGHVDMVCVKTDDSNHDFTTDPIANIIDGDWLRANNTTLGADNGIAIAMAMAVATNPEVKHPSLELLMTIDEETGLTGAMALDSEFVKGRLLINLDTEEDGEFIIGCAGGQDTKMWFDIKPKPIASGATIYELKVTGLAGGHSGVEIHKEQANAVKLLAELLQETSEKYELCDIEAGIAHNVIPSEAKAYLAIQPDQVDNIASIIKSKLATWKDKYSKTDPNISIDFLTSALNYDNCISDATSIVSFLNEVPHGVYKWSEDIPNFVETSNNLAIIKMADNKIMVNSSQRSSANGGVEEITKVITDIATKHRGTFENQDGYPGWEPNPNSKLLTTGKKAYQDIFTKEPKVSAIHAGLECGLIGKKFPSMDMISFGPTIIGAHSPKEQVNIPSIENCWKLLVGLLAEL